MVTTLTSTTIATQTRQILRQTLLLSASLITIVPTAIAAPSLTPIRPSAAPQGTTIANGTYLYGETSQRNQLGSTYLVFEIRNQTISGAVYWPGSAFECLSGQAQPDRLALTIAANQNQPTSTRNIALSRSAIVASTGKTAPAIGLEGMHPIGPLTSNDQRILKMCQTKK